MTRIILFLLLFLCGKIAAQNDLYKADEITYAIHKTNVGKVTFMNGNIPLAEYKKNGYYKIIRT